MITALRPVPCLLVGIHGHAGAGKDSVGNYLQQNYENVWGEQFARPLKEACAKLFGIPLQDFYDPVDKEAMNDYWDVSPRKIAQFVGTEFGRDLLPDLLSHCNTSFWIKHLEGRLLGRINTNEDGPTEYLSNETVVITDIRFQDEYDWIISQGGFVIHLTRPGADGNVGILNHASEFQLDLHSPERTYLIENNGTIEELYTKVDQFFEYADSLTQPQSSFEL